MCDKSSPIITSMDDAYILVYVPTKGKFVCNYVRKSIGWYDHSWDAKVVGVFKMSKGTKPKDVADGLNENWGGIHIFSNGGTKPKFDFKYDAYDIESYLIENFGMY